MEGKWGGRFPPNNVGKNRDKIGVSRGGVGILIFLMYFWGPGSSNRRKKTSQERRVTLNEKPKRKMQIDWVVCALACLQLVGNLYLHNVSGRQIGNMYQKF